MISCFTRFSSRWAGRPCARTYGHGPAGHPEAAGSHSRDARAARGGRAAGTPCARDSEQREVRMIDLHYWPTPNGHKITMFLEETGLPYRIVPVDIGRGEQFQPDFLAIAPNNRMPAIVDHEPARTAARRSRCSSPAPSCSTSPRRPAASSPTTCAAGSRCCSGCSGRWAGSGRWPGRTTISRTTRRRSSPTRSTATSTRPTGSTACWTGGSPTARSSRARLLDRRHGVLSVDRAVRAPGPEARGLPEPGALVSRHRGPSRPRSAPTSSASATSAARCPMDEEAKKILFGQTAASVRR